MSAMLSYVKWYNFIYCGICVRKSKSSSPFQLRKASNDVCWFHLNDLFERANYTASPKCVRFSSCWTLVGQTFGFDTGWIIYKHVLSRSRISSLVLR